MSSKALAYHVIICDGCGETFGQSKEFDQSGLARRAALDAGWKLIPKVRSNGRPVHVPEDLGRVGNKAKDACPTCAPTLQPQLWSNGDQRGGAWWMDRIKRLEEENQRLRGTNR